MIPQEHLTGDSDGHWMTNVPRNNVFFCVFSSSEDRFSPEGPPLLPQVRLVPGGMFL